MAAQIASQLKIYSLGIVAANKLLDSKLIEVIVLEDSPMINGEITDHVERYVSKANDSTGAPYALDIHTTNSIQAEWLPINSSNRITAPDVRRGETVVIYRFSDVDKYYWSTLKDDMHLRKLETVVFAISGTKDEGAKCTSENTYFIEFSTHKKIIHIHTSTTNGEPYGYDIQLNAGEGFLTIKDDKGNFIQMDSSENQISLVNADGSLIDVNKTNIVMDSINSVTIKSKTVSITSTDLKITANTVHNGNIQLNGNIASASGSSGTGSASFAGNVSATGNVTAKKVTSAEAIVAPNVH